MKKKGTQAQEAEIDFDITNERTIHSNDGKPSSGSWIFPEQFIHAMHMCHMADPQPSR